MRKKFISLTHSLTHSLTYLLTYLLTLIIVVFFTQCEFTQLIEKITQPSGDPMENTPIDGTWLLTKTDLSFTKNGETIHVGDTETEADGTEPKFTVILQLSRGRGKFYVKASSDARYRYCEKIDLSYTADASTFTILNAGKEPYTTSYAIEGNTLTLRKTIVDETDEGSLGSESTTLFARIESFDTSETNVETNCSYFETSEEASTPGEEAGVEAEGSCGGDGTEQMIRRGMEHVNGCGPEGAGLPSEISGALTRPCNCHDECYVHGHRTYGFSRGNCDARFLDDMRAACHSRFSGCIKHIRVYYGWKKKKTICIAWDVREPWCEGWAYTFYGLVASLGYPFFEDGYWYPYLSYMNCR